MMEAEVVVCYSSKDREKVMSFVARLRSMGVSVWIDYGGIDGALLWGQEIVENIEEARVLIFMASKSSVVSDNVVREVTLASENKKHILPLHLEPVKIPRSLKWQLAGIQHIELFRGDNESNFRAIARSLKRLGVKIEESVEPTKAPEPQATVETDASPHVSIVVEHERRSDDLKPPLEIDYGGPNALSARPTMKGPSAPPLASRPERLGIDNDEAPAHRHTRKRTMVIAGVAFISTVAVVLIVWFARGSQTQKQASTESQPSPISQPTKQTQDKPQPPAGMVYVPGGTFMMGRNGKDVAESPAHQITVAPFYIDLREVTNEDYEKFVQATSHRAPMTWTDEVYPLNAARKPVTGVTWDDANAYAAWAKKRLPTEEEWEFAARGTEGRLYPWGNAWQRGFANADGAGEGLADVGSYHGISPFGAFDMVGNAWEWTASDLHPYPRGHLPAKLPAGNLKVIRGGSYQSEKDYATTTFRAGWPADGADDYARTGFRCAADIAH
jgi:formylglycine-generating enzyme required for sulfatase activity